MRILAIDTSCDETAAAVTRNVQVLSNMVWSQAHLHSSFGGVLPSLAQRQHEERIDWIVDKAIGKKHKNLKGIDAVAVTTGPGLAIALGVGIEKAKNLASKCNLPLISVNHIEAHILSPLAKPKTSKSNNKNVTKNLFPAFGLVLSGGTTLLCKIEKIGEYEILAQTADDALGEALDKAARLMGFGYPGAHILEKFAREGKEGVYALPTPLSSDKEKNRFSYSGLKTAFVRSFEKLNNPTKQDVSNFCYSFQNAAFKHAENVLEYQIKKHKNQDIKTLLFGGGVANNVELRKRLRKICKNNNIKFMVPYTNKLNTDNAAMIGVCAYLKYKNTDLNKFKNYSSIDRNPRLSLN